MTAIAAYLWTIRSIIDVATIGTNPKSEAVIAMMKNPKPKVLSNIGRNTSALHILTAALHRRVVILAFAV